MAFCLLGKKYTSRSTQENECEFLPQLNITSVRKVKHWTREEWQGRNVSQYSVLFAVWHRPYDGTESVH